jgi:hypothetical protein
MAGEMDGIEGQLSCPRSKAKPGRSGRRARTSLRTLMEQQVRDFDQTIDSQRLMDLQPLSVERLTPPDNAESKSAADSSVTGSGDAEA